mmetsp:Transcript_13803/g.31868  ORF Transcript_13803/g.31868 Transcript_13803/m.31868 type:complete len:82 (+) Transcript_13803:78-323(+)
MQLNNWTSNKCNRERVGLLACTGDNIFVGRVALVYPLVGRAASWWLVRSEVCVCVCVVRLELVRISFFLALEGKDSSVVLR